MDEFYCDDCGREEYADCSVPNETWNKIATPNERLCPPCIDLRLLNAGLQSWCRFYFVGDALRSEAYLGETEEELTRLRAELAAGVDTRAKMAETIGKLDADLAEARALVEKREAQIEWMGRNCAEAHHGELMWISRHETDSLSNVWESVDWDGTRAGLLAAVDEATR